MQSVAQRFSPFHQVGDISGTGRFCVGDCRTSSLRSETAARGSTALASLSETGPGRETGAMFWRRFQSALTASGRPLENGPNQVVDGRYAPVPAAGRLNAVKHLKSRRIFDSARNHSVVCLRVVAAGKSTLPPNQPATEHDHIVVLRGASWADFQRALEIRGQRSVPRISYLEGCLQFMSPSRYHETISSVLGRLVEAWCIDRGIELTPVGSWTLEDKDAERGAEP